MQMFIVAGEEQTRIWVNPGKAGIQSLQFCSDIWIDGKDLLDESGFLCDFVPDGCSVKVLAREPYLGVISEWLKSHDWLLEKVSLMSSDVEWAFENPDRLSPLRVAEILGLVAEYPDGDKILFSLGRKISVDFVQNRTHIAGFDLASPEYLAEKFFPFHEKLLFAASQVKVDSTKNFLETLDSELTIAGAVRSRQEYGINRFFLSPDALVISSGDDPAGVHTLCPTIFRHIPDLSSKGLKSLILSG